MDDFPKSGHILSCSNGVAQTQGYVHEQTAKSLILIKLVAFICRIFSKRRTSLIYPNITFAIHIHTAKIFLYTVEHIRICNP